MQRESSLVSSLDRLSVKSITTGHYGSLLGLVGSAAFIVLSFVLFIGSVRFYFKGDYIQGVFNTYKSESMTHYSGCDFNFAVSFYSKQTGKLINHTLARQFFKPRVLYGSPLGKTFYAEVEQCRPSYFEGIQGKPEAFNKEDCYIVPYGLGYETTSTQVYTSIFGIAFEPLCTDPFICTSQSVINQGAALQRLDFFDKHYYVMRFTSNYVSNDGQLKKKFYEVLSTEWEATAFVIPRMFTLWQTAKMHMDDSIMPWINNKTLLYTQWLGKSDGIQLMRYNIEAGAVGAFITTIPFQKSYYRDYKKLDWLLGMLGGGIALLFLIFWVPCNFIATARQKHRNMESVIKLQEQELKDFNLVKQFLSNLPLLNRISYLQKYNQKLKASEKFIDIGQLVKKLKVSLYNLKQSNHSLEFRKKSLIFDNKNSGLQNRLQQGEIPIVLRQKLEKDDFEVLSVYANQPDLLQQCLKGQKKVLKLEQIKEQNKFSAIKAPDFKQHRQRVCSRLCACLGKIGKFCDVFGAKPNFISSQSGSSCFGCILTLLIVVLAILTFALTLRNMGVRKIAWDEIYETPEKQNITMNTTNDFRFAFCIDPAAYNLGLVTGSSRLADTAFYQYYRNGTVQNYQPLSYRVLTPSTGTTYFDVLDNKPVNLSYCFVPNDGQTVQVYGDSDSAQQAYFGVKLTPYCPGTPAQCQATVAATMTKFYTLLSTYTIGIALPTTFYYPDADKLMSTPIIVRPLSLGVANTPTNTLRTNLYLDTIEQVDHYASWMMGGFPQPYSRTLGYDWDYASIEKITVKNNEPAVDLVVRNTGKIKRVIFTSYKVDFLFATIGGCFAFFFFFFGCLGEFYNHYALKVKLAKQLYGEYSGISSAFKALLNWAGVFCCNDKVLAKIQHELDHVRIAKNVDSIYRLSVAKHQTDSKDLALIYLRQTIKPSQQEQQMVYESAGSQDDQRCPENQKGCRQHLNRIFHGKSRNEVQPYSEQDVSSQKIDKNQSKKAKKEAQPAADHPSCQKPDLNKFIDKFDLFRNNAQLTIDGQRTVKSTCGGVCCILMVVFIILLTVHFLNVYFSDFHRVGITQIASQDQSHDLRMSFTVGQDMKMAVSLHKLEDFGYFDVSALDPGISLVKYRVNVNNGTAATNITSIALQRCRRGYLDGFLGEHQEPLAYDRFYQTAYCVPDGVQMNLHGATGDSEREYFSIRIHNKYAGNATSAANVQTLLANFTPKYHISVPVVDYRADGDLRYKMLQLIRSGSYQATSSRTHNTTITKNIIKYDTALNPTNERPSMDSYTIRTLTLQQFDNQFNSVNDRFVEMNFYAENMYNEIFIQKIKVNEIFGIVGGCIVFLFFGLGALPRSFNEFKLRYRIGMKLYVMDSDSDVYQLTQTQLLMAWVLSFGGSLFRSTSMGKWLMHAELIKSRVSCDIDISNFLKKISACEREIKKIHPINDSNINLCRVYPKQIVFETNVQDEKQLESKINEDKQHIELKDAAKVNNFTYYQLSRILQAKKQQGPPTYFLLKQRWLEKYLGIKENDPSSANLMKYEGNDESGQVQKFQ